VEYSGKTLLTFSIAVKPRAAAAIAMVTKISTALFRNEDKRISRLLKKGKPQRRGDAERQSKCDSILLSSIYSPRLCVSASLRLGGSNFSFLEFFNSRLD
jgi:hypothetical protein